MKNYNQDAKIEFFRLMMTVIKHINYNFGGLNEQQFLY